LVYSTPIKLLVMLCVPFQQQPRMERS